MVVIRPGSVLFVPSRVTVLSLGRRPACGVSGTTSSICTGANTGSNPFLPDSTSGDVSIGVTQTLDVGQRRGPETPSRPRLHTDVRPKVGVRVSEGGASL